MVIEYLTGILAFITAIYAWLTFKMLQANKEAIRVMKDQFQSTTRPYIVANVVVKPDAMVELVIKNVGKSSAQNLKLTLDRPFYQHGEDGRNLQYYPAFSSEIDSLAPESSFSFSLVHGSRLSEDSDEKTPNRFEVIAVYNFNEIEFSERHKVDITPFLKSQVPTDQYLSVLGGIKQSLDQIARK